MSGISNEQENDVGYAGLYWWLLFEIQAVIGVQVYCPDNF
jgi:hypothetical protein